MLRWEQTVALTGPRQHREVRTTAAAQRQVWAEQVRQRVHTATHRQRAAMA